MAGPVALLMQLLAFLWSLAWRAWNFLANLNDNDWLAATSNENRQEQLFVQSESFSLPWTMEMAQLPDEDTVEFTCAYNLSPDSGLSDVQIDRIGVLRSVGVSEFYSDCLDKWPAFLRESGHRISPLDWSESSSGIVVARLINATSGVCFSPQTYPLVAFAFGSYTWRRSVDGGGQTAATGTGIDNESIAECQYEGGSGSDTECRRSFRCCLAAVLHLHLSPGQPASQIMRRYFLRWLPEQEPDGRVVDFDWQPRLLELRPYFSTADDSLSSEAVGSCAVCQSAPANILLLPCRHACVCAECAARLPSDLCPLCRRMTHSRMALPTRLAP